MGRLPFKVMHETKSTAEQKHHDAVEKPSLSRLANHPADDDPHCKQGRSKPSSEGPQGFGSLAGSLDVRNPVAVEGDRGCQDDKKHYNIREKRADADIHSPQLKVFDRRSSPLRKRIETGRFLFLKLFTRLPEK